MTKDEFKNKIKLLAIEIFKNKKDAEASFAEYDELTKFPELKEIIVSLLTSDFDPFIAGIDWVAPRYGAPDSGESESADTDTGGGEEVDVTVDDTVDVEA